MKALRLIVIAALLGSVLAHAAIPSKSWQIILTPSGTIDSRYPDGNVGTVCTWATIPNISVANGSSGTLDLRATYLTGTGCSSATVTLACSTSLPAGGFSYSGTTLTRTSTTSSTNSCTPTANGNTVGNSFLLVSSGNAVDTTAPNVPSIVSVSCPSTSQCDITVLPLNDPAIPSATSSGLKDVRIYRNGVLVRTQTVAAGLSLPLTRTSLGDAAGGASSQSTTSWTLSATGSGDFYGTADNAVILAPTTGISGDVDIVGYVATWTAAADFAKVGVGIRKTLDPPSAHVTGVLFPSQGNGVNLEHRLTTGASATQQSRVSGITAPQCLWVHRVAATDVETYYTSPNCNSWTQRQSATVAVTDPIFPYFALGQLGAGSSASVTFARASINNVPAFTWSDTGLSAGTTYTYTAEARDNTGTPNVSALSSGVTGTTAGSVGGGVASSDYPRLGAYAIGDTHAYDDNANIAWMCRTSVVIVGVWDGWQAATSKTLGQSVAAVQACSGLNPITRIFGYYNAEQVIGTSTGADSEAYDKFAANNWFLRETYPSGNVVPGFWGAHLKVVNSYYPGGPNDAGGLAWWQYWARHNLDINITGGSYGTTNGGNSAAAMNGLYADDLHWIPPAGGDFDRNGSNDGGDPAFWPGWRQGNAKVLDESVALQPQLMKSGNLSQWEDVNSVAHRAPFEAYFDAGVLENQLGSNSGEFWGGFAEFKARYSRQWTLLKGEKLGIFVQHMSNNTGIDNLDSTPYRAAWYGMAAAWVVGDGYYYATGINYGEEYNPSNFFKFDYYAVNTSGVPVSFNTATAAQLKWLGSALGGYTILSNGIHLRMFSNGFCAVNPRDNGTQSLTTANVGGSGLYRRISGTQRSSWDNGSTMTSSISMAQRDGICLQKL